MGGGQDMGKGCKGRDKILVFKGWTRCKMVHHFYLTNLLVCQFGADGGDQLGAFPLLVMPLQ